MGVWIPGVRPSRTMAPVDVALRSVRRWRFAGRVNLGGCPGRLVDLGVQGLLELPLIVGDEVALLEPPARTAAAPIPRGRGWLEVFQLGPSPIDQSSPFAAVPPLVWI